MICTPHSDTGQGKFVLVHNMKACGEVKAYILPFIALQYTELSNQIHVPAAPGRGKHLLYTLHGMLGGLPS